MADDFQDKTEEPTHKKLSDARKKGQVAKSQDLTSAVMLLSGMLVLFSSSSYFYNGLVYVFRIVFTHLDHPLSSVDTVGFWFQRGMLYVITLLAPWFLMMLSVAVAVNLYQVGFMISTEGLKPKFQKLNIFNPQNIKKFFDSKTLMRLLFNLSKLSALAFVFYSMIKADMDKIMTLMHARVWDIAVFMAKEVFWIGTVTAILLLILGIFDFSFQKWKFNQDMKMTRQEVKEERKQTEGDAQIKARIRGLMQQFSSARMKANVPESDVIIANPVHYAIAIKYDANKMSAPMCMAKGARKMALLIKEIAEENKVPIVENPPLARALYKVVEVGSLVPPEFYYAVAEVLAYVYRLNQSLAAKQQNLS